MPPPKPPPLMTKLKVAGEAELRTNGGRVRMNDLPDRLPLSPMKRGGDDRVGEEDESTGGIDAPPQTDGVALSRKNIAAPLVQTSTGTRYGRGLTGVGGGTNRQWGGGTPVCPKCGKLVYFAEQVSEKNKNKKENSDRTLTHLRRRGQLAKRFTKAVYVALNVTLDWTQEGCPRGMHGPTVTDVMQRCDFFFFHIRRNESVEITIYGSCMARKEVDTRYWETRKAEAGEGSELESFSPT